MVVQIAFEGDCVNETGRPVPVVFGIRGRQRYRPFEIVVLFGQSIQFIDLEKISLRPRAVPETHLSLGAEFFELLMDHCP